MGLTGLVWGVALLGSVVARDEECPALGPFSYAAPRDIHWKHAPAASWLTPFVSRKHRLIFCAVPKAGASFWLRLLRRLEGFHDWKRPPHLVDESRNVERLADVGVDEAARLMRNESWTKIAIVRDPAYRLLSAFLDKILRRGDSPKRLDEYSRALFDLPVAHFANETFADFVDRVELGASANTLHPHWQLLSRSCDLEAWLPVYDHVFNFDEAMAPGDLLPCVLDAVASKSPGDDLLRDRRFVDTFADLKHAHGSNSHHVPSDVFEAYYSRHLLEKVLAIYAKDYRLFGFDFPA